MSAPESHKQPVLDIITRYVAQGLFDPSSLDDCAQEVASLATFRPVLTGSEQRVRSVLVSAEDGSLAWALAQVYGVDEERPEYQEYAFRADLRHVLASAKQDSGTCPTHPDHRVPCSVCAGFPCCDPESPGLDARRVAATTEEFGLDDESPSDLELVERVLAADDVYVRSRGWVASGDKLPREVLRDLAALTQGIARFSPTGDRRALVRQALAAVPPSLREDATS